ncbi:MAG: hypothetical protein LBQ57_10460 [Spirochaetales bacterium]|jgi:hypothetical protein|nr:hypothetical protein [Spirochaetales bacterium]
MNDGYLLAECVIDYLVKTGFIRSSRWKHNTRELYYPVSFSIMGTRASTISFEITVSEKTHKITKSMVRTLERRFSKDFSEAFSTCLVA